MRVKPVWIRPSVRARARLRFPIFATPATIKRSKIENEYDGDDEDDETEHEYDDYEDEHD